MDRDLLLKGLKEDLNIQKKIGYIFEKVDYCTRFDGECPPEWVIYRRTGVLTLDELDELNCQSNMIYVTDLKKTPYLQFDTGLGQRLAPWELADSDIIVEFINHGECGNSLLCNKVKLIEDFCAYSESCSANDVISQCPHKDSCIEVKKSLVCRPGEIEEYIPMMVDSLKYPNLQIKSSDKTDDSFEYPF